MAKKADIKPTIIVYQRYRINMCKTCVDVYKNDFINSIKNETMKLELRNLQPENCCYCNLVGSFQIESPDISDIYLAIKANEPLPEIIISEWNIKK